MVDDHLDVTLIEKYWITVCVLVHDSFSLWNSDNNEGVRFTDFGSIKEMLKVFLISRPFAHISLNMS